MYCMYIVQCTSSKAQVFIIISCTEAEPTKANNILIIENFFQGPYLLHKKHKIYLSVEMHEVP
jgi:hypothetical protein